MLKVRLDSKIAKNDNSFVDDYSGIIFFSAIADPLFKYDAKTNSIICNACKSYMYNVKNNTWFFKLRKDLYFSNGDKVTAFDYKNIIIKIASSNTIHRFIFREIDGFNLDTKITVSNLEKTIKCDSDMIIIPIIKCNYHFYKIFSNINISPSINNLSAGPYYIYKINKINCFIAKNKFYRYKIKNEFLQFKIANNRYRDIKLFNEGKIQLTSNTMFPLPKIKKYSMNNDFYFYPNFIFIDLMFTNAKYLSKDFINFRRAILHLIPRNKINKLLSNAYNISDNYLLSDYTYNYFMFNKNYGLKCLTKYFKKMNKNKEIIKIGYDNFYPNLEILKSIKNELYNYNIIIEPIEDDYYNNNPSLYDMKLILQFPFIIDDLYFYDTIRIMKILNIDSKSIYNKYINILALIKRQKSINKYDILKLNNILLDRAIIFPILKSNSYYVANKSFKNFDFRELDYSKIN
jgi:ABC-type transport system substrate-binding protein